MKSSIIFGVGLAIGYVANELTTAYQIGKHLDAEFGLETDEDRKNLIQNCTDEEKKKITGIVHQFR